MTVKRSILLLDDDGTTREFLRMVIEHHFSVDIWEAGDHAAALQLIGERKPDLLMMDLAHPGAHGTELLAALRSAPDTRDIRVIILSGNLVRFLRDMSWLQYGFDAAFAKPPQLDELVIALARVLSLGVDPDAALIDNGFEMATLDYKGDVLIEQKKEAAGLAKDVIAMSNSGGGTIVVGVDDAGDGTFLKRGLAADRLAALEVTKVNNAIRPYVGDGSAVQCRVARHFAKDFVLIKIASARSLVMPRKDHEGAGLFLGRFYHRTDAGRSEEAHDADTIRALLGRFVAAK